MMQIIDCVQGSPEWRQARCGIITASQFSTIMAKGRGGAESVTRRKLLHTLAGERITGDVSESYTNGAMARGNAMEAEARDYYAFVEGVEPVQIGFVLNEDVGCSPDCFIGDEGGLEIKTQRPDLLIDTLLNGKFPPEHKAQVQGNMLVTGRKWWDLMIYYSGMPHFLIRSYRDEPYLENLAISIKEFNEDLTKVVDRINSFSIFGQD